MKKKFLFISLTLIVALCVSVLGLAHADTPETYSQVFQGEYEGENANVAGKILSGEASIVFGTVSTDADDYGIILTRYADSEAEEATGELKFPGKAKDESGKFGIALFNLPDGYYEAAVYEGETEASPVRFANGDVFNVTFRDNEVIKAGTFNVESLVEVSEDVKDYTVTASVKKTEIAGSAFDEDVTLTGNEFTAEDGWLYEICLTVEDSFNNKASACVTAATQELFVNTFNGNDEVSFSTFRFSTKRNTDEYGNGSLEIVGVTAWGTAQFITQTDEMPFGAYDLYFTAHFNGGAWENWGLEYMGGGTINTTGRYHIRGNVSHKKGDDVWNTFDFKNGDVSYVSAEHSITIDNIVYIPRIAPTLTAESADIEFANETFELTNANLGLTAKDCFGNDLDVELVNIEYSDKNGSQTITDKAMGATLTKTEANCLFKLNLKATDKYGNESTLSINLGYGDYTAPVITMDTVIDAVAGDLDLDTLISIVEENNYTVAFAVTGTQVAGTTMQSAVTVGEGNVITVEDGWFYEITVTATDEYSNVTTKYALLRPAGYTMISFDAGNGSLGVYPGATNSVQTVGTNKAWTLSSIAGWNNNQILVSGTGLAEGSYTIYFDVWVENWQDSWYLEFSDANDILWKANGRVRVATSIDIANDGVGRLLPKTVNQGGFGTICIDNVVLVPKA